MIADLAALTSPVFAAERAEFPLSAPDRSDQAGPTNPLGTPAPTFTFDLAKINARALPRPLEYGPPNPLTDPSKSEGFPDPERYDSFGEKLGAVKWEVGAIFAYTTITQIIVTKEKIKSFHFHHEGWFGKDTKALGLDKMAHAYNAYVIADLLHWRISRKTGGAPGDAMAAAALGMGLQFYAELFDAHKTTSGFSIEDVVFNTGGALLSALRNTVPGLRDKLDFRLMVIPNSDIYTFKGQRHYRQQRYILAATLSGFDRLRDTPLRFLELHAGYYATGFTPSERARGETPSRRPYVGIGINFKELLFGSSRSQVTRAAGTMFDYIQVPYTSLPVIR
ncbi:DUF2279 domain-containing protein [Sphingobium sp. SCG-1]|uniref:DUF2279 domain-containing protein n=1 Tax=Sphingobium sp. SCG-1 TaxID=2072936 RepID=UPI000CD680A9|nr:DUF2279 domain-containing protein [Sphingobium sp. SCG-1]AUW59310.1 DUF2279 domain-containing protein [Sphingobium sp. SCG-1]